MQVSWPGGKIKKSIRQGQKERSCCSREASNPVFKEEFSFFILKLKLGSNFELLSVESKRQKERKRWDRDLGN